MAVLQKKKNQSHLMCITDYIRNTFRKSDIEVFGVWEKNKAGLSVFRMRPVEAQDSDSYLEVSESSGSVKIIKVIGDQEEYISIKKSKQMSTSDLTGYINELKGVFKKVVEEKVETQVKHDGVVSVPENPIKKEVIKVAEVPEKEKTREELVNEKMKEIFGDSIEEETSFQNIVDEVTKKKCNICKLPGKDNSYTTLSLRYAGKEAKISLLYIAMCIYEDMVNKDLKNLMSIFNNSDDKVNKFIISQAENVYTFMRRSDDEEISMSLSVDDKVNLALMLKEVGTYFNVGRYIAYSNNILENKERKEKVAEIAEILKGYLEYEGISYRISKSSSTSSIYMELDGGKLGKIRLADHERSADEIPYNIVLYSKKHGYVERESENGNILKTFYSTHDSVADDLKRVVKEVVDDRTSRIMKMGMVAYKE